MENYHNDINIKFEHTPDTNKIAFNLNHVGAHDGDAIEVTTLTHTDANTIYVDGSTGNDSNLGTSASPKLTILATINATTATKIYGLVLNSQHFAEDLSTATTTFLTGLFADTAITATLSTRVLGYTPADANSIFFGATSGTGGGVGTEGDPSNTIALAVGLTDATHQAIVEVDGDTYTEAAIEFTGDFLGMYAADGVKPTYKPTYDVGTVDYTGTTEVVGITEFDDGAVEGTGSTKLDNGNVVVAYGDSANNDGVIIIYDEDGDIVLNKTIFDSSKVDWISASTLTGGDFVISYSDTGDGGKGKFVVYSEAGAEQVAPTVFESGDTAYTSVSKLNNGNFVISYRDVDDGGKGKFGIYEADGDTVSAAQQFEAGSTTYTSVAVLANDNFVICYNDSDANDGKFIIRQEDGSAVSGPTTFEGNSASWNSVVVLDDTNFIIFYRDSGPPDGKLIIRQQDGTAVSGPTTFNAGDPFYVSASLLLNGDVVCCYADDSGANNAEFVIHNPDGTQVVGPTEFEDGNLPRWISTSVYDNGNFVCFYEDNADSDKGKFVIYQPYTWSGLKVSAGANINGWVIDANDSYLMEKLIKVNSAKPTIKWCDLINTTNPSGLSVLRGRPIGGDNETDVYNCKIYDNAGGIYLTANVDDCIIQDNEFYRNTEDYAIYIDGAAGSSGDITVEHCDLFQNYAGIRLENNHGTNEIIKNNIIHNNNNYAIEADTAATLSNSVRTDPLSGASDGSSVLLANPLYINEGATDPTAIDLNIKTKVEGFPSDSPAKDLADDTRNAGSHDIRYIGSATTWTSITVAKPRRGTIEVWYEAVGGQKSVGQDGTVEYSKKGQTENVKIKWVGLLKAEFDLVRAMWASTESEVRIYFQPTTSPDSYNTYTMTRRNLTASVPQYELSEKGVASVELDFARKYEEP